MSLEYIVNKYDINIKQRMPINIPNQNREDLATLFFELGYKLGVEVGVERGLYSEVLCKANPNLTLYCVDQWKKDPEFRDHVSQEKFDNLYTEARGRLNSYNCSLIKLSSVVAVHGFQDNSLDFVYIDANHEYKHVVEDIFYWSRKVRPGGIVSGHDFIKRKDHQYQVHVVEAVTGYTQAYHISPWFVMGSKHPQPNEKRDRPRSWFWVKE